MKNEPIRILQCVNVMDRAGLETMLMNYYRNIDHSKVQFDFLTHRTKDGAYDEEIKKMGGKIYHAPRLIPTNYFKYRKYMRNFFLQHKEYSIIHSHIDTMSFFPLYEAKQNKIKIRISHSHTSKLDWDLKFPIKFFGKLLITKVSNVYFACGKKAGKFLFGNKKFSLINNAIDMKKFQYNEKVRNKKRKELGIDKDCFVIGHVGRYIYIKNQKFLIDVFEEILKVKKNSRLILIGNGPDEEKLKIKVNKLKINDKVVFLKNRSDVNELYQVMDCFVMPSLFEGVPLVAIEAQTNGLACILSDNISSETLVSDNVYFLNNNLGAIKWANIILNLDINRNQNAIKNVRNHGYDVKVESKKLQKMYLDLYLKSKEVKK